MSLLVGHFNGLVFQQTIEDTFERADVSFDYAILPMGFTCAHSDSDGIGRAMLQEGIPVEASLTVDMIFFWMVHECRPLWQQFHKLSA